MPLAFPDIGSTNCFVFRACGSLIAPEPSSVKALSRYSDDDDWRRASIRSGDGMVVLATMGYSKPDDTNHVHVDVVRRDIFKRKLPGRPAKLDEIRDSIMQFKDEPIDVDFEGHFRLDESRLPGIVSATIFEKKIGTLSVATKSVSFRVKDGPLYGVTWSRGKDGLRLMLEARTEMVVDGGYLLNGFELILSAYKGLSGHD